MLYKFKMNKIENNFNSYNKMVGGANGAAPAPAGANVAAPAGAPAGANVAAPAEANGAAPAPAGANVAAPAEANGAAPAGANVAAPAPAGANGTGNNGSSTTNDTDTGTKSGDNKRNPIMWFLYEAKVSGGISKFVKTIMDEPCLKDISESRSTISDEDQAYSSYVMKKIGQNFDHLGFFNWEGSGKGEFKKFETKKFLKAITLPTIRKMAFCFIKIAFSPLYLFYLFFVLFASFLESLNMLNFFRAVGQIFMIIIGFILCIIPPFVFVPAGRELVLYAMNMTYENKDDNNRKVNDKKLIPVWGVIQFLGGMMFPLQIFNKGKGHTFGYGGITIMSVLIMIISTVVIIYSGISMVIIICVFINYFYKVITGLKKSATGNTSNK